MTYIGAHVSISGGIQNGPIYGAEIGCECIQIFTRSPQGGYTQEISLSVIDEFTVNLKKNNIKNVYVHGPYYINLASSNNRIKYSSSKAITEELQRASQINAKYVMVHIGTAKDLGQDLALRQTIEMLKKSLDGYMGSTKLLLENSAGAGQIIGDDLKELRYIIDEVNDQNIAGICLDTQHSWASGYDWRDFDNTLKKIDQDIGISNIKLMHINDSLTDLASNKDRHAHIGEGKIGIEVFKNIVHFANKNDTDLICETEWDKVAQDISILKSFR